MDESYYDDPTIGDASAHSTGYNLLAMHIAAMEESDGGQGSGFFGPGAGEWGVGKGRG